MSTIADIRKDYSLQSLTEKDVARDPFNQFTAWWNEALHAAIEEVNAMTLATASSRGMPDARVVLLKGYDTEGFVFYSNYQSVKGRQLEENPYACLVFFWKELERQVRIRGRVEKVGEDESEAYFNSRPPGSRIGAWASPQSSVIENREWLESNEKKYAEMFRDQPVPRPAYWGGYRARPDEVEFWQGRSNRLHDRIAYTLQQDGLWIIQRLAP